MAKPDLGEKRQCQNCGTKFFDLGKTPITCPKCGTVFEAATVARGASRATAAKEDDEVETDQEDAEVVSLEDADQVDDGKVTATNPDDDGDADDEGDTGGDDDDTFLEEDDEDDGDVSGLVDNERDEDEER